MTIIILEDEGITAFFLQESLRNMGHEVIGVFDNGVELITFLKDNAVDLIFTDINIKGVLDGIQTAQKIYLENKDTFFVFLTSYKDSNTIKEAQFVKPLGYLVKPISEVDLEIILMVVESQIGKLVPKDTSYIYFNDYKYHLTSKNLYLNGDIISLSLNEKLCIETLINNKNTYLSNQELIEVLWTNNENKVNSLRELIFRLKKKLPNFPISSTPKIGYVIKYR